MPTHYKETPYGFEYGSAQITRVASDENKGWVVLRIGTPKHKYGVTVYVTKTGKVRIHSGGGEWTPPKGKK